jgi:hypothetical protein
VLKRCKRKWGTAEKQNCPVKSPVKPKPNVQRKRMLEEESSPTPTPPTKPKPKAPKVTEERCVCIVTTKNKEKKICGNKAKYDGRCGIHRNKCIVPVVVEEEKKAAPDVPVPQKRIVDAEITEVKEEGKCPCIIVSRKIGVQPKVCGRKIKENGKCGIHQRTCNLPETVSEAPAQEGAPKPATCAQIIKKTGKVCGRPTVKGSDKCARHQKEVAQAVIVREASPPIAARPPTPPAALDEELKEFAATLDEDFLDDIEEEEKLPSPADEPIVLGQQLELQEPQLDKEWSTIGADFDSISQYIEDLDQKPAFDLSELSKVDQMIQECLSL